MKFETALKTVHSQAGRKAIARNSLFGAISSLRSLVSAMEGMTKSITVLTERGYDMRANAIRTSNRFLTLEDKIAKAASRAQGIYAIASASFDFQPEFEPGVPKHLSRDQLAQIADFSGLTVDKVTQLRNASDEKRYRSEMEAMSMTEAMFWAAEPEEDPDVKAESVLKALNQTVQFIATWSSPDFAELGVLKHDIQIMETVAVREMDHEDDREELGGDGTSRTPQYRPQEEIAE